MPSPPRAAAGAIATSSMPSSSVDAHVDVLGARGRQVLADVVRPDRQLAMAAVDEHRQLHARGPAVVEQRLDRRAHRAAGEQHVVDDHDRAPGDVEVDVRGVHDGRVGAALRGRRGRSRCRDPRAGPPRRAALRAALAAAARETRHGDGSRSAPASADRDCARRSRARRAPALAARPPLGGRPSRCTAAVHRFLPGLSGPG